MEPEITRFAYNLGLTTGLLCKDSVMAYLHSRGVSIEEIMKFEAMALSIANAFYSEDQPNDKT
jgi:hypothetical protein